MSELQIKERYVKEGKWLQSVLKVCLNCFSSLTDLTFHLISDQPVAFY